MEKSTSENQELDPILEKATAVFGSLERANEWMLEPAFGLDLQRPIDVAATAQGRELVETYLGQIEYGVYI